MKAIVCEMCGSQSLIKKDGMFVCEFCGTKYSPDEAKKLMIEGTVDVKGTVKIDNSALIEKYLRNARRAYDKEDWEEVEKYYNLVEQNAPNNIEAVFFSSFGKAMATLHSTDYYKRQHAFKVLTNSISVINEYFEETDEDKRAVLQRIDNAISNMSKSGYVRQTEDPRAASNSMYQSVGTYKGVGSASWQIPLFNAVKKAFLTELKQIEEVHPDLNYIKELISKYSPAQQPQKKSNSDKVALAIGIIVGFIVLLLLFSSC